MRAFSASAQNNCILVTTSCRAWGCAWVSAFIACASPVARPTHAPAAPIAETVDRRAPEPPGVTEPPIPTVLKEPSDPVAKAVILASLSRVCMQPNRAEQLRTLAACFHGSVRALQTEPDRPPRGKHIPDDALAAFLARAITFAPSGSHVAATCGWLNDATGTLRNGRRARIQYLGSSWSDGCDFAQEEAAFRVACGSEAPHADIVIIKKMGGGIGC